ncbi:MAG: type II secretion system protein [bacterium]|nr:type II secretion system protein [bacterium]
MKNKKGFTLVELLAVIVVLSLVMIIAIPAITKNSATAKEAILKTKVNLIVDEAVIWGQDNLNYFLTSNKGPLKNCTGEDDITCSLTFNDLAQAGYIKYDDEENNLITDPTKKKANLNDEVILISYSKNTGKVTSKLEDPSLIGEN